VVVWHAQREETVSKAGEGMERGKKEKAVPYTTITRRLLLLTLSISMRALLGTATGFLLSIELLALAI
jgi:hypothetical protein